MNDPPPVEACLCLQWPRTGPLTDAVLLLTGHHQRCSKQARTWTYSDVLAGLCERVRAAEADRIVTSPKEERA